MCQAQIKASSNVLIIVCTPFDKYERSFLACTWWSDYFGNTIYLRPLQFKYLSYKLFLEKKSCQTPKKEKKKVDFGVLRTKVV